MGRDATLPTSHLDRRALLWLALGLAALLGVRIAALRFNGTDLFFDEAQYWSWSVEPAFGYYSKPPLIAWVIRLATDACGLGEACVRLPSPILHTLTALAVFALGRRLYDTRIGVVSALVFATLPGVSMSAGIISTDVPLLLFWAIALAAFAALLQTASWIPAVVLGLAFGLGLNAKYAMAWFILCVAVYLAATPARRSILRDARLYAALGLGVAMIVPNLAWNLSHSFATFSHTADNAKWSGALLNIGKGLEFIGAQFGVFGPILFASLVTITWRAWKRGVPDSDRLLLAFALPVLVIISAQGFISRAHANWAAVSYVAATVLVTATLMRDLSWGWLRASLALHVALVLAFAVATATAGRLALPAGLADPFARTLGWRELADATRAELERAKAAGKPFGAVITDDREVTAELLYYMRSHAGLVVAWRDKGRPRDHYELTRPFTRSTPEPVLLVSLKREQDAITGQFASVTPVGVRELPAGRTAKRRVAFYALSGYRGP